MSELQRWRPILEGNGNTQGGSKCIHIIGMVKTGGNGYYLASEVDALLTAETARADAAEKKLETALYCIGSHACSGRDCIGVYAEWESATQNRCGKCDILRQAIGVKS